MVVPLVFNVVTHCYTEKQSTDFITTMDLKGSLKLMRNGVKFNAAVGVRTLLHMHLH